MKTQPATMVTEFALTTASLLDLNIMNNWHSMGLGLGWRNKPTTYDTLICNIQPGWITNDDEWAELFRQLWRD